MYNTEIWKVYIYLISVNTESIYYTYFTTYTQVILRKWHKSTAPYISS